MRASLITAMAMALVGFAVAGAAQPFEVETPLGQLVFQRGAYRGPWNIVAMRPNGAGSHVLATNGFSPAASRDGRFIAFVREAPGKQYRTAVWVMNADGTGQRRITAPSMWYSPAWSPDGETLFVSRDRPVNDGQGAIFTLRANGTGLRRLTAWDGSCEDGLEVSPDGLIATYESFSCDRPQRGDIEAIDMRGRQIPILEQLPPPPGDQLDWPGHPAWSPDGSLIAFARIEGLGYGGAYVAKPDGSNVLRLSPSPLQASSPAWSADGASIALTRDRVLDWGYPGDIWIVRSDGTGLRRLTNTKRIDERSVTWLHSAG